MSLYDSLKDQNDGTDRFCGVAVATVTNNQDPDHLGRVRIRLACRNSNDESDWVRVATLMAGNGRGTYFLPEVGDEVLVAFEDGRADSPIVIGSLWNGKDQPPEGNDDGKNRVRIIKSRGGHKVVMTDDPEGKSARIEIISQAGHAITLDDTNGAEKVSIVDKSQSSKIVMDTTQRSISIQSGSEISIKADQIKIEAMTSLTMKTNGTFTISGLPVKIN